MEPPSTVKSSAPAMIASVQGQTTDWSQLTAMGGGLQQAIDDLTATTRRRSIVLFTDGILGGAVVTPFRVVLDYRRGLVSWQLRETPAAEAEN